MRALRKVPQYAILVLLSIVFLMPFLWMLSTSLKGGTDDIF
jgi:multiple sugar transport system permease protein